MARVATSNRGPGTMPWSIARLETHVRVARALGAEIALGGEAGEQRGARVIHGARGAQRQRLVQHLVVPAGLVVRMQEEMAVAFDESRQQRRASEIDAARIRGRGDGAARRRRCARR